MMCSACHEAPAVRNQGYPDAKLCKKCMQTAIRVYGEMVRKYSPRASRNAIARGDAS